MTAQFVRKGVYVNPDCSLTKQGAVSLTTDETSIGHGLPDGRKISDMEAEALVFYSIDNGEKRSPNLTKYRLKIEISEDDENLKRAKDCHSDKILSAMELTAYYPTKFPEHITDIEIEIVKAAFKNGVLTPKGSTWWYYFSDIPDTKILEIASLYEGRYLPMTRIEFYKTLQADMNRRRLDSHPEA